MNEYKVHLLDLPNEILFLILKNLDNIDVLYSLLGINNQRLDNLAQEQIFCTILNFVFISHSTHEISSISDSILNRFRISILPRIHQNVKSLILEPVSMESILFATHYPNLTELKLFNFNKAIVSRYFMDDSLSRHICKEKITDLILICNGSNTEIKQEGYTKNVYAIIFAFFENLKQFTLMLSPTNNLPPVSLYMLPSMTFSSSTLTKLCLNVNYFDDCLALLDGRLKQLTTFILQVIFISDSTARSDTTDDLPNLKCFSLICYRRTEGYDSLVVPLFRRMSHLEELTLYICILNGPLFIAGTDLDKEVLIHMSRLHTFTFYISSKNDMADPSIRVSELDIQRTFTNTEHRPIACMVDYVLPRRIICRVFSLPFQFNRLEDITNYMPNMIFNSVTHLTLWDIEPFKHEFFARLTRSFPFLQNLYFWNLQPPFLRLRERHLLETDWCSIVEYPHLISLDVEEVCIYYVECFLDQTKTHLPRLTELKICYEDLRKVTDNFRRDATRRNCAHVKRLIIKNSTIYPKDLRDYFPLLTI